jgi:hypothetical protein
MPIVLWLASRLLLFAAMIGGRRSDIIVTAHAATFRHFKDSNVLFNYITYRRLCEISATSGNESHVNSLVAICAGCSWIPQLGQSTI